MDITYHQNGIGNEYGEDHKLTNNWDPDMDYGNEYARVYFRINTPSYDFNKGWIKEDRATFNKNVFDVFTSLGWSCKEPRIQGRNATGVRIGRSATWVKGKAHLYMHPQAFSGVVFKNEIKIIAEALEKGKAFSLRWVDLYDTVYDITDEEYEQYLSSRDGEIRKMLFAKCRTKKSNIYHYASSVCVNLAEKFGLKRIINNSFDADKQTMEHIMNVIEAMAKENLLFMCDYHLNNSDVEKMVRTPNKTEQKKLKINPKFE